MILLLLYRIIIPKFWDGYFDYSELFLMFSWLSLIASFCIILVQVILDKASTYKTTADSIIIVIPVILLFWLELFAYKDYVHKIHIDRMGMMYWLVKGSNSITEDLLPQYKPAKEFEYLYTLLEEVSDNLIYKSGGIDENGSLHNPNNDEYADFLVVEPGYLEKVKIELDAISKGTNNEDIKNRISYLQLILLGDYAIHENTVTEMLYRLELIRHHLKLIELELSQAKAK